MKAFEHCCFCCFFVLLASVVVGCLFNFENIIFQVVVGNRFYSFTPSLGHFLLDLWNPWGDGRGWVLVGKFIFNS